MQKITKKVQWRLWSEDAGAMTDVEFFITIDLSKIPVKVMQKAMHSGKSTALGGAISISKGN